MNSQEKVPNKQDSISSETKPLDATSSIKVLLAEDDFVSRNMVTIFLKKHGFTVTAVENGKEAILVFEKERFDIVLMDVNMPYLDGYSATGVIRALEENKEYFTPVIAMTAYALKGDREKCLVAGMNDYISKPIDLSQLVATIKKHLIRKEENNKSPFAESVIALMEDSGLDKETCMAIVKDFCGQGKQLIKDIRQCNEEDNQGKLGLLVHRLKGSAGNVRAKEIAKKAIEIEQVIAMADYTKLTFLVATIENLIEDFVSSCEKEYTS